MLTENKILEIANNYVKSFEEEIGMELTIPHESIIKKPYGNIFYYITKKYYETRNDKYGLAGNAPFLVENTTGNIIDFGTARSIEYYLKEYEAGRYP